MTASAETGPAPPVAGAPVLQDPVDDAVRDGVRRRHEVVALHVGVDAFAFLPGVVRQDLLEALAERKRLAGMDLDVAGLALKAAGRLMYQHAAVRQDRAF